MSTTNYGLASAYKAKFPRTHIMLRWLIMSMTKCYNNRGKMGLFGQDKGLKAFKKYEEKLRDTLLCMEHDGIITNAMEPDQIRIALIEHISAFAEIYPNWPEAYAYSEEAFIKNPNEANKYISRLYYKKSVVNILKKNIELDNIMYEQEVARILKRYLTIVNGLNKLT